MAVAPESRDRVTVHGKFFRLGDAKFHVKGVTYGPFGSNAVGHAFAPPEQTELDFRLIRELGANVVRVYDAPPRWFLDLAHHHGLKVLVDVPWNQHQCFLDHASSRNAIRESVRHAARQCAGHPAVLAISVANEIPADIVRWSGSASVACFLDDLVHEVKAVDADCLCTFGNFPPTEFLQPQSIDFLAFNLYLHQQRPFENYLARLQMIADTKPLLLAETGIDTLREGEENQAAILAWQVEKVFRGGLAGVVVFSLTDEWHRGGQPVLDWAFGLTNRKRLPRPAFLSVQQAFQAAPYFRLPRQPMVSVVVACYNGARTLKNCLESLTKLNYPAYEVILVDDGSTDTTPQIASLFASVRYVRHINQGLSVARNTGLASARGEIIAYTDADCRADEDWLYYLVGDLLRGRFAGIGGHNFLPPDDSAIAAAVMVSPGGPAHVMLTDRVAEHIPGCNMAFYKWAIEDIGGFDPVFKRAGDDVDICWRLQQRGLQIGFSPGGFVWHYRRSTVRDYLRQQHGYGEAEALLVNKHPEYFNSIGGNLWQGRIYSPARSGVSFRRPMIYHGVFGSGLFQTLYAARPAGLLAFCSSLEFHALITLPLTVLAVPFHFLWPLAAASFLVTILACAMAAAQAVLPKARKRLWSKPLVGALYFLQPIVRGFARYQGRLALHPKPLEDQETLDSLALKEAGHSLDNVEFWSKNGLNRRDFLVRLQRELDRKGWQHKADSGWDAFDVEILGSRWSRLQLTTVMEAFGPGRHMLRCRLKARWSLLAKTAFMMLLGVQLLVIGVLGRSWPWLWSLLLTMPLMAMLFEKQKHDLRRIIVSFLEEAGKKLHLLRITRDKPPVASGPQAQGHSTTQATAFHES